MPSIELSAHARDMITERHISEEWVWRAVRFPDWMESGADGNQHYFKAIEEYARRILHVVANEQVEPHTVVTVFFDRRQRRPA